MMNAIVAVLALFVLAGGLYNLHRADELDEREEDLDKYSVHLDERANKLAEWERELNNYDLKK